MDFKILHCFAKVIRIALIFTDCVQAQWLVLSSNCPGCNQTFNFHWWIVILTLFIVMTLQTCLCFCCELVIISADFIISVILLIQYDILFSRHLCGHRKFADLYITCTYVGFVFLSTQLLCFHFHVVLQSHRIDPNW